MNTDMSRRQFVGLAGSLATVLGLGLVGCGGGAGKGSAAGSAAAKDVKAPRSPRSSWWALTSPTLRTALWAMTASTRALTLTLPRPLPISRLGCRLRAIDWDAKDTLLNSGAINCIWNGFTMEGREDGYTFSEPYMLNEQVLVVKKDAGIKSWDDLAGKTVITQTDSAAQDVLEGDQKDLAATFATLDTIGEYNTAFMQLESGAVDAVACDLSIAQYQLAAKPDAYTQLDKPLSSEHYAVGFKKGDTKSADAVTESLKALYEDGTVKDLCDKYAEYGLSFDNWVLK